MEDLLPSELCTICHAAPPKYRCPRCSIRTCSLPCTTRHKNWAQCSGVRDPTRFIKREELATPEGIDHDFNFLTGIERTLDRAERDAERRGIEVQERHDKTWMTRSDYRLHHPAKGEIKTRAALEACQVIVQRAPKGMARGKQNRTMWHKKRKTLDWTVEWILNDGTSKIGTCPANVPIAEGYAFQFPNVSQFSKVEPAEKTKKRRHSHLSSSSPPDAPLKPIVSPRLPSSDPFPHTATTVLVSPLPTNPIPPNHLPQPSSTLKRPHIESPPPSPDLSLLAARTLHFYLLHPGTPSPTRVLIPLSPNSTLTSSLRHRVVLEFPTVYALRFAPDKLPTGFLTEEEYLGQREQKRINLVEATLHENPLIPEADDHTTTVPECFNAEQLLDVLKRDLGVRNEIRNHRYNRVKSS